MNPTPPPPPSLFIGWVLVSFLKFSELQIVQNF
jgi:hypothetical protein